MLRNNALGLAAIVIAAITPSVQAQLSYVSQSRSVYAQVGVAGGAQDVHTVSAPDFGVFNQTASSSVGLPYPGSSSATQVSSLLPTGIDIATSFASARPAAAGTGSARMESTLDVLFSVDQPTTFTLSGLMPASEAASIPQIADLRTIQLTGPGVSIDLVGPGAFSQTGSFSVGQYHLLIDGDVKDNQLHFHTGSQNFNVSLVIPEPVSMTALCAGALILIRRRRLA